MCVMLDGLLGIAYLASGRDRIDAMIGRFYFYLCYTDPDFAFTL